MKQYTISVIVGVLMTLAFIALNISIIYWAWDAEEFIATMWAIATLLGSAAFELNYFKKNFVRD